MSAIHDPVNGYYKNLAETAGVTLSGLWDRGQEITSIITKKSVENLKLSVGLPACAVIKSSEVMIAVD
jgi:molybdopterin-binding protein